jgi:hypothetical protein
MCNWFKKLFCGGKCKCHEEKKGCCEGHGCCSKSDETEATTEVKPSTDSSTPEVKM